MKDKMTWTTLSAWAGYISGLQWEPSITLETKDSSLNLFNHNLTAMKNCKHILKTNFFLCWCWCFWFLKRVLKSVIKFVSQWLLHERDQDERKVWSFLKEKWNISTWLHRCACPHTHTHTHSCVSNNPWTNLWLISAYGHPSTYVIIPIKYPQSEKHFGIKRKDSAFFFPFTHHPIWWHG